MLLLMVPERKARVDAVWEQMSKGVSVKTLKSVSVKCSSTVNKPTQKSSTVRFPDYSVQKQYFKLLLSTGLYSYVDVSELDDIFGTGT